MKRRDAEFDSLVQSGMRILSALEKGRVERLSARAMFEGIRTASGVLKAEMLYYRQRDTLAEVIPLGRRKARAA